MKALVLGFVLVGVASPALAQTGQPATTPAAQQPDPHAGHQMPGMGSAPATPAQAPVQTPPTADPHAGHVMPGMEPPPAQASVQAPPAEGPHAGHVMPEPSPAPTTEPQPPVHEHMPGMTLPAPQAPAPPAPTDNAADRYFDRERMAAARHHIRTEHGGAKTGSVTVNIAEYQFRDNDDGYRWDAEGWFGGDVNRLVLKTEGEGTFDADLDDAEVQALYARAISPYFNLEAGLRYDFEPESRTYAVLGVEGVAPYWFDLEAAAFLSDEGDLLGRVKASQDFRLTQRLLFQPRLEMNLAAQDVPESEIGAGLSNIELGIRLRYEFKREFAPYVGVSWQSEVGDTADFARASSEDVSSTSIVVGLRTWF